MIFVVRNHRVRRVGASILRNLVSDRVCCASTRSSGADGWGVQALSVQEKTSEDMVQVPRLLSSSLSSRSFALADPLLFRHVRGGRGLGLSWERSVSNRKVLHGGEDFMASCLPPPPW